MTPRKRNSNDADVARTSLVPVVTYPRYTMIDYRMK